MRYFGVVIFLVDYLIRRAFGQPHQTALEPAFVEGLCLGLVFAAVDAVIWLRGFRAPGRSTKPAMPL
jgi:hypothetical protein